MTVDDSAATTFERDTRDGKRGKGDAFGMFGSGSPASEATFLVPTHGMRRRAMMIVFFRRKPFPIRDEFAKTTPRGKDGRLWRKIKSLLQIKIRVFIGKEFLGNPFGITCLAWW